MSTRDRVGFFDDWAADYDRALQESTGRFPYDGYGEVLSMVVKLTRPQPNMRVLDLGTGTGNLAARFVEQNCLVWGVDFSVAMLAEARHKVRGARFVHADLLGDWPAILDGPFERIVSAYVLHEFDLPTKLRLISGLADRRLAPGGWVVVADVSFPDATARDRAREAWIEVWDRGEHYWVADEAIDAFRAAGLEAHYKQVSDFGGVFLFAPLIR